MKKERRLAALLLVLAMVFALLPSFVPTARAINESITDTAYPVTDGNIYFDKETGAITGCSLSTTSAIIPDKIDGITVTQIKDYAFASCADLQNVEIPYTVIQIGKSAFQDCKGLQNISIPDSVTEIGDFAFYGCKSLKSVEIPNGITQICNYMFSDCESLQSIEIPADVTKIGKNAFRGCTSLQNVKIPSRVTKIDNWAFFNCKDLEAACFLGNAPELGMGAFQSYSMDSEDYWQGSIPGLTLYYIEGKEGWTTPTWNDYPTRTWDGKTMPSRFTDVAANSWFAGAVKYAVTNNLFNGTGDGTTFSPNMSMSRAMLVTVLHRQAGTPASSGENIFSDVPNASWYTKAVLWASENNIVTGSNGKFMPNDAVTREQISVILFRYTQKQGKDTSNRADLAAFPDGDLVSGWAKDAMQWAVAEKLISGNTKGELMPKGEASRAQVATILMRYIENILK